jgi:hypothetical protein
LLVAVSIVAVIATVTGYIAIIRSQGAPPPSDVLTVPFVAGYLLAMAVLLAISVVERPRITAVRPALRAAASAGLLGLGVLSLFSIGLAIIVAAAFAIAATVIAIVAAPHRVTFIGVAAGVFLSLALLVGGFEVAWNVVVCPPDGQSGGTTASGMSYECNGGVLTTSR